jgi:predicted SnoaL-like aldol condensation-catalyzing enzyme
MTKKEIAVTVLQLASSGQVSDAYEQFIHPRFIHHNAYFRGDRESFRQAMQENAREFPDKTYETLRMLEDGDLVAVHGKVVLSPESVWSVIHIFRFENMQIIESWEA